MGSVFFRKSWAFGKTRNPSICGKAAVGIVFVHCCFDVDVLSFVHEGGNADRTVVEIAPDDSFESETKFN